MRLSQSDEEKDQFLRIPVKFQKTFLTPLKDMRRFVAAILSSHYMEHGCVTIDQVVFEPTNLMALLARHSISVPSCIHTTVTAFGRSEISTLLSAVFGDSVDFLFMPSPRRFAIYADHDEYATFLADSQSDLNMVTAPLEHGGFTVVPDFKREF